MNASHYAIALELNPVQQDLSAKVKLTYHGEHPAAAELTLLLHRDLVVDSVVGEHVVHWDVSAETSYRYTPEARELKIQVSSDANEPPLELAITYHGHLGITTPWEVNRLTTEWVELGMYTPWFPWDPSGAPFTYDIRLRIPPEYRVHGLGKVQKQAELWRIEQTTPVNDMVIVAAPGLHVSSNTEALSVISAHPEHHALAELLAEHGEWTLAFFRHWLIEQGKRAVSVVIAPRAKGGGYARPGLVVMTPGNLVPSERYFSWLAHELGHLWWCMAPTDTWEDWLNEAFAEYSSLVAARERYGREYTDSILSKRREQIVGLPPIVGIDRSDEQAYQVLYFKGSLLLFELGEQIGHDAMTALLRRTIAEKVSSTEHFLRILGDLAGAEVKEAFYSSLRQ